MVNQERTVPLCMSMIARADHWGIIRHTPSACVDRSQDARRRVSEEAEDRPLEILRLKKDARTAANQAIVCIAKP